MVIKWPINALDLGTKRLNELLEQYGEDLVHEATVELKARASKLMRAYISRLPDGEFEAVDWLDNDRISDDLKIKIKLKISGEKMILDFSDTSPACLGPVNILSTTMQHAMSR